jgi:hypothetical protein
MKEYAFRKSEYPVIISIENHCGPQGQQLMARYFMEILGSENMYIIDTENPSLPYPSPHDLKRKFIILQSIFSTTCYSWKCS